MLLKCQLTVLKKHWTDEIKHVHATQGSIIIIRITNHLDLQWKLLTKMQHTEQWIQEVTIHNDVADITVSNVWVLFTLLTLAQNVHVHWYVHHLAQLTIYSVRRICNQFTYMPVINSRHGKQTASRVQICVA